MDWQDLLSDAALAIQLELALSESRFLAFHDLSQMELEMVYNVDGFIAYVRNLKVCKNGFKLLYQPRFFQQIAENQKVLIDELTTHKTKHIRLSNDVKDRDYGYAIYVLFPHMAIA